MSRPNAHQPVRRPTAAPQAAHLGYCLSDPTGVPHPFLGAGRFAFTTDPAAAPKICSVSVYQIGAAPLPLLNGRAILGRGALGHPAGVAAPLRGVVSRSTVGASVAANLTFAVALWDFVPRPRLGHGALELIESSTRHGRPRPSGCPGRRPLKGVF